MVPINEKPLILIGCTPIHGHISPTVAIAKQLVARGYNVTAVSSSHFESNFTSIGCKYIPITGYGDFWEGDFITPRFAQRALLPPGPPQIMYDMEYIFINPMPSQHEAMQKALAMLKENHPGRKIVQLAESVFLGSVPILRGAEGIKPDASIALGLLPVTMSSIDTAPSGPGVLPDTSPEGRERNKMMQKEVDEMIWRLPTNRMNEVGRELGCGELDCMLPDAPYLGHDRFLQFCIPSAEYVRSDRNITYTGGLPKGKICVMEHPPSWWSEVVENKEKKDIVFVCQGSLPTNDFAHLTIPAMEALKDRPNTLAIVAVGGKGRSLPEGTAIPGNARVVDYLPYDEILPHAQAFISNAGWGGYLHAITNGTPYLAAGEGEDKPETAARIENSGMGVNLRSGRPTTDAIRKAADEMIENPKYKKRAMEMQAEMEKFNPMEIVVKTIGEVVM